MSELEELYQQVILDHNKKPRNFRKLDDANRTAEGYNPLCGDKVTIYLQFDDDAVQEISFQGSGCAISTASASVMTTILKGLTSGEVDALYRKFHSMLTKELPKDSELEALGKLAVFSGVREFPVRVKCATLAWHTLRSALDNQQKTVSTE